MQSKHLISILALAVVTAGLPALAQTSEGVQGGPGDTAGKARAATKAERQAARRDRRAEVSRENKAGELSPGGEASGAPAASGDKQRYTREQRREARRKRLEESAKQNRSGNIPSGER